MDPENEYSKINRRNRGATSTGKLKIRVKPINDTAAVDTVDYIEFIPANPSSEPSVNLFMFEPRDSPKKKTSSKWLQKQIKRRGLR